MAHDQPVIPAAPVSQQERIVILDSLRGIAVLGILLMNIPGFGLPHPAIFDYSLNEQSKLNYTLWYVFGPGVFEGSQRAIFSMLFGASSIIYITRLEKRAGGLLPAELFLRRQLWLLVFGLFNAYILLWFWDILYTYAICGIILFAFRRLKPKYLLIAAGVCLLLMTARENRNLYRQKSVIKKGEAVAVIDTTITTLTGKQKEQLAAMEELKERSKPEIKKKEVEKDLEAVRGSYKEIYESRSNRAEYGQTKVLFNFLIWDILLFMVLGMAFFKMGILQGEAPAKLYAWMTVLGLGAGLPLSYLFVIHDVHHHFNWFEITKSKVVDFYEIQRFIHSLGLFGLLMLVYKSRWFKWLFVLMKPVGRMAFTNYLMQSVLCGFFFYGIGLGYFGKLQIYELYYVVAAVWLTEIVWSHLWLRYFWYGPLEWCWRSLTYWKKQPFKKSRLAAEYGYI
jgi:uncharacterized protein